MSACDYILRNGIIVDGTGGPRFAGDVAIQGDRIIAVGDVGSLSAHREIDIKGDVVSPGFIDVHAHDDAALLTRPEMLPKLTQGVTTTISGNCGLSAAPYALEAGDPPSVLRLLFKSRSLIAPTFDEYAKRVSDAEPAINSGFLTGHTTLRLHVLGEDHNRPASESETAEMRELLAQSLAAGALGFSTGLFYAEARAAPTREVIEIAQPLACYRGMYVTHLRNEGDHVVESMREAFEIGRAAQAPVVISHHKCLGRKNFGRTVETLALLSAARQHQSIGLDVYPYTAGSTVLSAELVEQSLRTIVTWCDPHPRYVGWDLAAVASDLGCTVIDAIPRLQPAGALYFMMAEEDVIRIMQSTGAMIGSDGLPEDQHPHPRLWGTFPRVLAHFVREQGVLTLEDAVHRMTGMSAARFGLEHRGLVRVGGYADLCVFDPGSVADRATYEEPRQPSAGIQYVFVNGRIALEAGTPTGVRAGRVLRRATH